MAKGKHREYDRLMLPNGMVLLLYKGEHDGMMKIAGYDRRITIIETKTRPVGTDLFFQADLQDGVDTPAEYKPKDDDLICVRRSELKSILDDMSFDRKWVIDPKTGELTSSPKKK